MPASNAIIPENDDRSKAAAHPVDTYIRGLAKSALALSQKEWRWGMFTRPNGDPIETVDHVCEAQDHSARQSERAELWGVDLGADEPVICYTGNGPCSKDHAQFIAATQPRVLIWLLDELGGRIERRDAINRDLLEALKAVLAENGALHANSINSDSPAEKLARAAIQRAEGGT